MATAGLLAGEIERARVGLPAAGHDVHEPCANCGTVRQGPYCHECGQAGHVHRNLMALVHDIAHGVFHFEGKIWKTLPMLALRPGELTKRYIAGERAKFVSPIALFLFSVFLMFAVVSNLSGGHGSKVAATQQGIAAEMVKVRAKLDRTRRARAEETDPEDQARLDRKIAELSSQYAAMQPIVEHGLAGIGKSVVDAQKAGADANAKIKAAELAAKAAQTSAVPGGKAAAEVESTAAHVDSSVTKIPYVGGLIAHAAQNPELVVYKMKNYAYKYSWALIPISVPLIWLLFCFRRDVGLYDHAIFGIYSLSFMSLAMVVLAVGSWLGMPGAIIPIAAMIVPPVHMYRQLKGAYGLGRYGALWRTAALLIMTTIALSLFSSFVFYMGSD
ncbi:DUF3667 domain-containing protein [Sphingomonas sp. BIUV-7]|uniref:DUF3667 domain-containing protein n=2 Tax=Sphingomonas natans TaxID=3063330 RepID=A0ABT8YC39_9SPHN|nr:DUF3667 domain-containing protein [Sphingomonas sp. BIUV-7]